MLTGVFNLANVAQLRFRTEVGNTVLGEVAAITDNAKSPRNRLVSRPCPAVQCGKLHSHPGLPDFCASAYDSQLSDARSMQQCA